MRSILSEQAAKCETSSSSESVSVVGFFARAINLYLASFFESESRLLQAGH